MCDCCSTRLPTCRPINCSATRQVYHQTRPTACDLSRTNTSIQQHGRNTRRNATVVLKYSSMGRSTFVLKPPPHVTNSPTNSATNESSTKFVLRINIRRIRWSKVNTSSSENSSTNSRIVTLNAFVDEFVDVFVDDEFVTCDGGFSLNSTYSHSLILSPIICTRLLMRNAEIIFF